jgi:hypothetical protein
MPPLLVGAENIGLCDDLILDSSLQVKGSGGRAFKYKWTLNYALGWVPSTERVDNLASEMQKVQSIQNYLLSHGARNTPTGTLRINANLVPAGSALSFRVELTNFLDESKWAEPLVIQKENRPIPSVMIDGPPVLRITRSDGLNLIAQASVAMCTHNASLPEPTLSCVWYRDGKFVQSESKNPKVLKLASGSDSLQPGMTHAFKINCTDEYGLWNYDITMVDVQPAQLVANVRGSSVRTVGSLNSPTLDGSRSFDPDDLPGVLEGSWQCTPLGCGIKALVCDPEQCLQPCNLGAPVADPPPGMPTSAPTNGTEAAIEEGPSYGEGLTSGKLKIRPGTFIAGCAYSVAFIVSKVSPVRTAVESFDEDGLAVVTIVDAENTRESTYSIDFDDVVEGTIPEIEIERVAIGEPYTLGGSAMEVINVQSKLVVQAFVLADTDVEVEWTAASTMEVDLRTVEELTEVPAWESEVNQSTFVNCYGAKCNGYHQTLLDSKPFSLSFDTNWTTPIDSRIGLPLGGNIFMINPNSLTPGGQYKFRFTAMDRYGMAGYADISFLVNTPPTSGYVEVSPSSGTAFSTQFAFRSVNWVDDQLPLLYHWVYSIFEEFDARPPTPVNAWTQRPLAEELMLPSGCGANDNNIYVWGQISDSLGAVTTARAGTPDDNGNPSLEPPRVNPTSASAEEFGANIIAKIADAYSSDPTIVAPLLAAAAMELDRLRGNDGTGLCHELTSTSAPTAIPTSSPTEWREEPPPVATSGPVDLPAATNVGVRMTACPSDTLIFDPEFNVSAQSFESPLCSGHGACVNSDWGGYPLDEFHACDLETGIGSCTTSCNCVEYWHGEHCEFFELESVARQEVRGSLIALFREQLGNIDLDTPLALEEQLLLLALLSNRPDELNEDAAADVVDLAEILLTTWTVNGGAGAGSSLSTPQLGEAAGEALLKSLSFAMDSALFVPPPMPMLPAVTVDSTHDSEGFFDEATDARRLQEEKEARLRRRLLGGNSTDNTTEVVIPTTSPTAVPTPPPSDAPTSIPTIPDGTPNPTGMPTIYVANVSLAKDAGAGVMRVLRALPTAMLASTLPGEAPIYLETPTIRLAMRRDKPELFHDGHIEAIGSSIDKQMIFNNFLAVPSLGVQELTTPSFGISATSLSQAINNVGGGLPIASNFAGAVDAQFIAMTQDPFRSIGGKRRMETDLGMFTALAPNGMGLPLQGDVDIFVPHTSPLLPNGIQYSVHDITCERDRPYELTFECPYMNRSHQCSYPWYSEVAVSLERTYCQTKRQAICELNSAGMSTVSGEAWDVESCTALATTTLGTVCRCPAYIMFPRVPTMSPTQAPTPLPWYLQEEADAAAAAAAAEAAATNSSGRRRLTSRSPARRKPKRRVVDITEIMQRHSDRRLASSTGGIGPMELSGGMFTIAVSAAVLPDHEPTVLDRVPVWHDDRVIPLSAVTIFWWLVLGLLLEPLRQAYNQLDMYERQRWKSMLRLKELDRHGNKIGVDIHEDKQAALEEAKKHDDKHQWRKELKKYGLGEEAEARLKGTEGLQGAVAEVVLEDLDQNKNDLEKTDGEGGSNGENSSDEEEEEKVPPTKEEKKALKLQMHKELAAKKAAEHEKKKAAMELKKLRKEVDKTKKKREREEAEFFKVESRKWWCLRKRMPKQPAYVPPPGVEKTAVVPVDADGNAVADGVPGAVPLPGDMPPNPLFPDVEVKKKKKRSGGWCSCFSKAPVKKWAKKWENDPDRYGDMLRGTRFQPTRWSMGHGGVAGPKTVPPLGRTLRISFGSGQLMARFWEELKRHEPWFNTLCVWYPHYPRERRLMLLLSQVGAIFAINAVFFELRQPYEGGHVCRSHSSNFDKRKRGDPVGCVTPVDFWGNRQCEWEPHDEVCWYYPSSVPGHEVLLAAAGSVIAASLIHIILNRWTERLPQTIDDCKFAEKWDEEDEPDHDPIRDEQEALEAELQAQLAEAAGDDPDSPEAQKKKKKPLLFGKEGFRRFPGTAMDERSEKLTMAETKNRFPPDPKSSLQHTYPELFKHSAKNVRVEDEDEEEGAREMRAELEAKKNLEKLQAEEEANALDEAGDGSSASPPDVDMSAAEAVKPNLKMMAPEATLPGTPMPEFTGGAPIADSPSHSRPSSARELSVGSTDSAGPADEDEDEQHEQRARANADKRYALVKRSFEQIDADGSGEMTIEEAVDAQLRAKQGVDMSNPKVRKHIEGQFAKLDLDGSGTITMAEYMTCAGFGDRYREELEKQVDEEAEEEEEEEKQAEEGDSSPREVVAASATSTAADDTVSSATSDSPGSATADAAPASSSSPAPAPARKGIGKAALLAKTRQLKLIGAVAAEEYECENACGFSSTSFDTVVQHEEGCTYGHALRGEMTKMEAAYGHELGTSIHAGVHLAGEKELVGTGLQKGETYESVGRNTSPKKTKVLPVMDDEEDNAKAETEEGGEAVEPEPPREKKSGKQLWGKVKSEKPKKGDTESTKVHPAGDEDDDGSATTSDTDGQKSKPALTIATGSDSEGGMKSDLKKKGSKSSLKSPKTPKTPKTPKSPKTPKGGGKERPKSGRRRSSIVALAARRMSGVIAGGRIEGAEEGANHIRTRKKNSRREDYNRRKRMIKNLRRNMKVNCCRVCFFSLDIRLYLRKWRKAQRRIENYARGGPGSFVEPAADATAAGPTPNLSLKERMQAKARSEGRGKVGDRALMFALVEEARRARLPMWTRLVRWLVPPLWREKPHAHGSVRFQKAVYFLFGFYLFVQYVYIMYFLCRRSEDVVTLWAEASLLAIFFKPLFISPLWCMFVRTLLPQLLQPRLLDLQKKLKKETIRADTCFHEAVTLGDPTGEMCATGAALMVGAPTGKGRIPTLLADELDTMVYLAEKEQEKRREKLKALREQRKLDEEKRLPAVRNMFSEFKWLFKGKGTLWEGDGDLYKEQKKLIRGNQAWAKKKHKDIKNRERYREVDEKILAWQGLRKAYEDTAQHPTGLDQGDAAGGSSVAEVHARSHRRSSLQYDGKLTVEEQKQIYLDAGIDPAQSKVKSLLQRQQSIRQQQQKKQLRKLKLKKGNPIPSPNEGRIIDIDAVMTGAGLGSVHEQQRQHRLVVHAAKLRGPGVPKATKAQKQRLLKGAPSFFGGGPPKRPLRICPGSEDPRLPVSAKQREEEMKASISSLEMRKLQALAARAATGAAESLVAQESRAARKAHALKEARAKNAGGRKNPTSAGTSKPEGSMQAPAPGVLHGFQLIHESS